MSTFPRVQYLCYFHFRLTCTTFEETHFAIVLLGIQTLYQALPLIRLRLRY